VTKAIPAGVVAGEPFEADGAHWLCYLTRADGVICSEYVGPALAAPVLPAIDYSMTCAHRKRHGVFTTHCDEYVVLGTRYCRKHQYVQRYPDRS
jgi:hypothetical protein